MEDFGSFEREFGQSMRLDGKNRWSGDAPIICLRRRLPLTNGSLEDLAGSIAYLLTDSC